MNALPGLGGTLFPLQYLADRMPADVAQQLARSRSSVKDDAAARQERARQQCLAWWRTVDATCGPATGLRALLDLVADPFFGRLGFRIESAVFQRDRATGHLMTPAGTPVGLVVLPWAARPSAAWRDLVAAARTAGAAWCFLLAPPYLSLVDARGHAVRRGLDVTMPDAFDPAAFARLWALARATSFDPPATSMMTIGTAPRHGTPIPAASLLDELVARSAEFQSAVRSDLQAGVVRALSAFGRALGPDGRGHDDALTLVFRVLFLLFAESRDLVPRAHPVYRQSYSVEGLCRDALRRADPAGLWEALAAITRLSRAGCRSDDLIVRPFNGALFAKHAAPTLERRSRFGGGRADHARDHSMREALIALGTRPGSAGREQIAFADLGVEQLGAVYERVLDLTDRDPTAPIVTPDRARHSRVRKETGTFYTPQSLADFVVRRTLAPLTTGASSDAILALRVLDPAMGSGAFLVSACRYLAGAYERALLGEGRLSAADVDRDRRADFRRIVAERCLAGVDLNPIAVQLARLSLWLTSLAHGKPLGFLDHRLRVGNSLIGATPDDLSRLAPRRTPTRGLPLFDDDGLERTMQAVSRPWREMARQRDDTAEIVRAKNTAWSALIGGDSPLAPWRRALDVWCARWFHDPDREGGPNRSALPPLNEAEARAVIHAVLRSDATLPPATLARRLNEAAAAAATQHFFHWPIEFADIFYDEDGRAKSAPGFDAIIGNPPWEMLRRDPRARGGGARLGLVPFLRESGLYPSCDRGHINLYQPFVERALNLARPGGRVGLILPWGLASDVGAAGLRRRLFEDAAVDTIVGLDNAGGLFPIHRGLRFLVVVASPGAQGRETRARFGVRTATEIDNLPGRDDVMTEAVTAFPVRFTPRLLARVGG